MERMIIERYTGKQEVEQRWYKLTVNVLGASIVENYLRPESKFTRLGGR
jgi:hypothetical protein